MNNSVFGVASGNLKNHGNIRLLTTLLTSYLMSQPNFHTAKSFSEFILAIEMSKPIFLGLSILEINKTVMLEFWYDYITAATEL